MERRAKRRPRPEQYLDPKAERGRRPSDALPTTTSGDVANCMRSGEVIDGARAGGGRSEANPRSRSPTVRLGPCRWAITGSLVWPRSFARRGL